MCCVETRRACVETRRGCVETRRGCVEYENSHFLVTRWWRDGTKEVYPQLVTATQMVDVTIWRTVNSQRQWLKVKPMTPTVMFIKMLVITN